MRQRRGANPDLRAGGGDPEKAALALGVGQRLRVQSLRINRPPGISGGAQELLPCTREEICGPSDELLFAPKGRLTAP
ncbi:hypothetical protein J7E96_36205 [Streptomyces sp. ISL-96]|uniref:hypothetical protein n=1 Tax=Streptomyces sp. ISL-96 TaxID=2819191 RepID=UPI001BEBE160|nr:hypothetical protein [Streptomyces sp. ISL-96]MBT2493844.1 hypothetical protein [Streptomyces sp. ISL-96]